MSDKHVLVYDFELKAPACVLIQAIYGCGSNSAVLNLFESKHWLTSPTPGMRKTAGTEEQWEHAAAITAKRWGSKSPHP